MVVVWLLYGLLYGCCMVVVWVGAGELYTTTGEPSRRVPVCRVPAVHTGVRGERGVLGPFTCGFGAGAVCERVQQGLGGGGVEAAGAADVEAAGAWQRRSWLWRACGLARAEAGAGVASAGGASARAAAAMAAAAAAARCGRG